MWGRGRVVNVWWGGGGGVGEGGIDGEEVVMGWVEGEAEVGREEVEGVGVVDGGFGEGDGEAEAEKRGVVFVGAGLM